MSRLHRALTAGFAQSTSTPSCQVAELLILVLWEPSEHAGMLLSQRSSLLSTIKSAGASSGCGMAGRKGQESSRCDEVGGMTRSETSMRTLNHRQTEYSTYSQGWQRERSNTCGNARGQTLAAFVVLHVCVCAYWMKVIREAGSP